MSATHTRQLVRNFLDGISAGSISDDLLTPDVTFWTVSSGAVDKARFLGGIKLLAKIANQSIHYEIVSLTAEEDRVVAEVRSSGTLINGEALDNNHVFLFQLRDGKIAHASEYMNQQIVREKVVPLMQAGGL